MSQEEKNSQEEDRKVIVDTKEDGLNERINRLYGLTKETPKKEPKNYDPKEIADVRKKLLFLLGGVVFAGIIIVFLLISPLLNSESDNLGPTTDVNEENNNESNDIGDNQEDNSHIGELNLYDDLVASLSNRVSFTSEDLQSIDIFPLYTNDVLEVANIPDVIKLHLLRKDDKFIELLVNKGIEDYITTCVPDGFVINRNDIDGLVKTVFGPNVILNYDDINYNYYSETGESKKITLSYSDDKYIVKCNEYMLNNNVKKIIQQKLYKAIGTKDSVELYQRVVFITYEGNIGVYKDPMFNNLITNEKTALFEEYIDSGASYKYTFTKDEENYYLSKIELVKEDN